MALTDPTAEPELLWVLNTLMEVKASAEDTGGTLTVIEQLVTPAGNPPLHVHHHEDEAFLVLEGELKVTLGKEQRLVGRGQFVFGPRGVAHTYEVLSPEARLLVLATPGGVERFFRAVGQPAPAPALPPAQAPDVAEVVAVAGSHGITLLAPGAP